MEGSQRSEATPRLPVELEVDCATEQMAEPVTLTTQDVGEGGLFLKTEFPLDPGTRFGCRFHVGSELLLAEGEVAWIRNGPPESDPPPGMGVRFVAVNPEDSERLRQFVLGIEADPDSDGDDLPRVSFQLHGLGQPLPGEFRAMSESGIAAVAELPFLQVGSTVQVNIDEPGREGPLAGRIAWLSLERDEDAAEGDAPKIRLGIHFDDAPTPEQSVGTAGIASEPVPLTQAKTEILEPATDMLAEPTPEEIAAVDTSFQTPWQADMAARPRASGTGRRRRPRGRQAVGALSASQIWSSVRERASANPKAALGVGAGALVLMLTLGMAFAFSGSSGKKKSKAKKPVAAAKLATPTASLSPDTPPPALMPPTVAAPGAPGAPGVVPGAPPLPASGTAGKAVLTSGPGVNVDPARVLGKGAAGNDLLADPGKAALPVKKNVHSFAVGRKFVVKLSLRSKPGRVKHYLLANPDGAVIDVAGATPALKPGRYKVTDGRVRMVKVLHRGKGSRFIVYYGKRVKKPKISVVSAADGVNFIMSGVKKAQRRARPGLKKSVRGRRVARRIKRPAKRKLRKARKVRKVRTKPIHRRRVAPVADASD